ncbi:hypothetical protein KUC3_26650 [Alteromonas sp. KC3]|uniref:hypothetical protein n=1 Tax=unclassified Alteromonas TaxID=2614992 RepID=UPI00192091DB|nr:MULTISPECIES: hypothetical protein [unclassified Alteromonas]BCO19808.1 hypothetical protein KUC3_26650 [Alteromonas sp. KC3]BCO23774.1 hypothetical protein KUC14_26430 [Alteromonas sp. KC14]
MCNEKQHIRNSGVALVEVLVALFFFVSTSVLVLDTYIQTKLLLITIVESKAQRQIQTNQKALASITPLYEQHWDDIVLFGKLQVKPVSKL